MKFLLIGCNGKMGKSVCQIAKEMGDEIVAGIDVLGETTEMPFYLSIDSMKNEQFDAIIDFSSAKDHCQYIKYAIQKNLPFGLFSTRISAKDEKLISLASKKIPFLRCANASLGVNLMYGALSFFAQRLPSCDCAITEYHHKNKVDRPSGTAKEIQKILNSKFLVETNCFRVGEEKGFHKVEFFFGDEILTISHKAKSRDIFARGALEAMHKLADMPAGNYDIKKLL